MKRITLDYRQEITIADEAFEQIAAIVQANRVCEGCGNPYAPDRPNVALNRCVRCFLTYHANQGYTYIKLYDVNQQGSEIHWFLDPFHLVHFTTSTSKEAQQSYYYTLLHWGFPVPETWQDGEETKPVNHWHWSFYGDPQDDQVLLIHNTIDYGSQRSFDFLSYRDGRTIQIDRKRGEGRRLFFAAKKRIEATHDGHGYHMDGQTFYSLDTYWLRRVVAKIANEEYGKATHHDTGKKQTHD